MQSAVFHCLARTVLGESVLESSNGIDSDDTKHRILVSFLLGWSSFGALALKRAALDDCTTAQLKHRKVREVTFQGEEPSWFGEVASLLESDCISCPAHKTPIWKTSLCGVLENIGSLGIVSKFMVRRILICTCWTCMSAFSGAVSRGAPYPRSSTKTEFVLLSAHGDEADHFSSECSD